MKNKHILKLCHLTKPNIAITEPNLNTVISFLITLFTSVKLLMLNYILPLRVVNKENTLQFCNRNKLSIPEYYKPLHCFNDYGCHTGVLVACGLELTTQLGVPGRAPLRDTASPTTLSVSRDSEDEKRENINVALCSSS